MQQKMILFFVIALATIAFSGCIDTSPEGNQSGISKERPSNLYQLHAGIIALDLPKEYNAKLNENSQIITIANDITPNKRAYMSIVDLKNKINWFNAKLGPLWLSTSGRSVNDVISSEIIFLNSGEGIVYGKLKSTSGDYWHFIKPHISNNVIDKYIQMTNSTLDVEIGKTIMRNATIEK